MSIQKRNPNLLLLTALILLSNLLPASVAKSQLPTDGKKLLTAIAGAPQQQVMSVERSVDGSDFINDMFDAASALKSYTFDYETTVFKGNKVINQEGSFFFKSPPRMLRVEMTGDYKHGAVAVLGRDGKVRGHLGGALSPFTVTLDPNSDMLLGANGYPLVDSDFFGMAKVVKKFLQDGCKARVSEQPVAAEGQSKKVYVLEIFKSGSANELYKRAYVDPQSLLPVEWFDYQNGRLFARTVWKDLKFDANMKDDVFKI